MPGRKERDILVGLSLAFITGQASWGRAAGPGGERTVTLENTHEPVASTWLENFMQFKTLKL